MQESVTAPLVGGGLTKRGRTIALLVVLLAFFMDVLDGTIVNVAIPSIQENLGASYSAIQWIIAGYALAFALFLITGGRLGDIFGYKKVFLAGIVGFTAASAFCGFVDHHRNAGRRASGPGFHGGDDGAADPVDHPDHVHDLRGAAERLGVLRRPRRRRHRHRPDPRRAPDLRRPLGARLARDLSRQRAGRHSRRPSSRSSTCRTRSRRIRCASISSASRWCSSRCSCSCTR